MMFDGGAGGAKYAEGAVQACDKLRWAEYPDAGGRQLQGERQASQTSAQRRHTGSVGVGDAELRASRTRPLDEERPRWTPRHGVGVIAMGQVQRTDLDETLTGQAECFPAGGQHHKARTPIK